MDLKNIVELSLSPAFMEDTIQYLQCKNSDHRQIFSEVFPELCFRPKHHFVEHYPNLMRCFGSLVHLWTMRFEGKHWFFKRVVHDTQNFKHVTSTLATRHRHMMAYHLSSPSNFKPNTQTSIVSSVLDSTLPDCAKVFIQGQTTSCTVYTTSGVTVDGTDYAPGMFVSVVDCLSSGGLMKSFLSITLCHCYAVHLSHGMLNMYALMSIHQCQGYSLFFRFQIRMTW